MKNTGKLTAILIILAIIVIEAVVLAGGIGRLRTSDPGPKLPTYDLESPDKLEWRVLCPVEGLNCDAFNEAPGAIAMEIVGNFDLDQDDEICLPT